jgi:hypothetical protein
MHPLPAFVPSARSAILSMGLIFIFSAFHVQFLTFAISMRWAVGHRLSM